MSDVTVTYRLKSDSGLTSEISLQTLQQMVVAGKISDQRACTADNGQTWIPIEQLINNSAGQHDAVSGVRCDVSSLSASDTTVKASSETIPEGLSSPRKLKRMSVNSGKSRFTKATVELSKQKTGPGKIELKDLVGSTLPGGRYKVLSQFGSGSMAYVFRASDNRLETDVIIKVPKPEKITTDDFRERFKRESQLLVRLSHPHVVKVVDVGEFDDLPYVVMQLLSGGTLLDRMRSDSNELNQMAPSSLQLWVREVARALDFCYKKGMVHRDVKPANILFDDDDNAYVSDFGLTKIMHGEHTELCSSGTANGVVLGTPNYLPPEIILGAKYDGRADQYSLAMTVYHALCGRPPMQGTSATLTMINQTQKKLELLSSFRADVPRELALAVQKGIEKNPQNRFETCEEFAMAVLDGLRTDQSSSSIIPPSSEPAPIAAAAIDSGAWYDDASASSSKRTKRKATSSGAKTKKKSSSASSSSRMKSEWVEPAKDKVPPRKGTAARSRAARQKAAKTNTIAVFGHEVHPGVLAAAGLFALLPTVVFLVFQFAGTEDSEGLVTIAPVVSSQNGDASAEDRSVAAQSDRPSRPGRQAARPANQRKAQPQSRQPSLNVSDNSPAPAIQDTANPVMESAPRTEVAMLGNGNLAGLPSASPIESDTTLTSPTLPQSEAPTPSDAERGSSPPGDQPKPSKDRLILSSQPAARVTHGPPNCPAMVVGNNVWDIANRRQSTTLEGDYDPQVQTVLSPDGRYFAAAAKPPGQQNTDVVVWDTSSGRKLFTASGDSKRFVDIIMLSSDNLLIGDRWSDELLVWNCESGKQKKAIKIPGARFRQGNTALSNNGEFIAAVVAGQLCVFNASDGAGVVKLASPRAKSRKPDSADALNASLQSLTFSPDNSELASISSLNGTRMFCWNGRGEVVLEHVLAPESSDKNTVQWFASRKAWLLGNNVFDRDSKSILLTALSGDESRAKIQLFDDDHLCGYFPDNPDGITLAKIPWDEIDSSVLVMPADKESSLRPDAEVSIVMDLNAANGLPDEGLRKAMKAKLNAIGLKVSESQRTRFVVRITSPDEVFVPKRNRQLPRKDREMESYPAVTGPQLVMELLVSWENTPVWCVSLGDASALLELEGVSETERSSRVDKFILAIENAAVPFYLPSNEDLIALPAVLW